MLDTVTISEWARPRANPAVLEWLQSHRPMEMAVSVLTIAEIERGVANRKDAAARARLREWADGMLVAFRDRIIPIDVPVAIRWGTLFGSLESRGETPPLVDSLIAATALVHGLTIVTRNTREFERCGVHVVNPWDG